MQLIDAMDSNDGMIRNIYGYKIAVINMAAIDNTSFSTAFLDKIKAEELWSSCEGCPKLRLRNYQRLSSVTDGICVS